MKVGWPRWGPCLVTLFVTAAMVAAAMPRVCIAQGQTSKVTTKDGVKLALTYYRSREDKDATPVVLLHDFQATQGMFTSLAARLNRPSRQEPHPSYAVVTVDLRGHGASTQRQLPNGQAGEIDAAKLGKQDFIAMSVYDMEAVRGFLVGENDNKRLNLNKLSLVGVGMGATVATYWAARDWMTPPLLVGKQGQDVKAMVLVSPQWKYRGVMLQPALKVKPLKQNAAWMLVWGSEKSSAASDIRRIAKQIERYHPEPKSSRAKRPRSFQEVSVKTSLQGSNLFSQVGAELEDQIIQFLTQQVAEQELPWSQRRNRLD